MENEKKNFPNKNHEILKEQAKEIKAEAGSDNLDKVNEIFNSYGMNGLLSGKNIKVSEQDNNFTVAHDVSKDIELLIGLELANANSKFSPFNTEHEAWAVLKEEAEEAEEEVSKIKDHLDNIWSHIRNNIHLGEHNIDLAYIRFNAVNGIKELIQVAAMCDKYVDFIDKKTK